MQPRQYEKEPKYIMRVMFMDAQTGRHTEKELVQYMDDTMNCDSVEELKVFEENKQRFLTNEEVKQVEDIIKDYFGDNKIMRVNNFDMFIRCAHFKPIEPVNIMEGELLPPQNKEVCHRDIRLKQFCLGDIDSTIAFVGICPYCGKLYYYCKKEEVTVKINTEEE